MKRTFDLVVAAFSIIILFPVFVVIATMIWLDDHGPILYRQERVGRSGKLFILYKFRTMKQAVSGTQGRFDPGDTSRVTRIGKVLRRRKLDELPQLFNVLKGDMSLVGPRPEIEKWVSLYPERWEKILKVRPGITDNASILYRDEESLLSGSDDPVRTYREEVLPKKLSIYESYVTSRTFFGDLNLIFRTIFHSS